MDADCVSEILVKFNARAPVVQGTKWCKQEALTLMSSPPPSPNCRGSQGPMPLAWITFSIQCILAVKGGLAHLRSDAWMCGKNLKEESHARGTDPYKPLQPQGSMRICAILLAACISSHLVFYLHSICMWYILNELTFTYFSILMSSSPNCTLITSILYNSLYLGKVAVLGNLESNPLWFS